MMFRVSAQMARSSARSRSRPLRSLTWIAPRNNLARDTSEMRMHLRDRVAPGFSDTWREASLKHGLVLGSQYQDIE